MLRTETLSLVVDRFDAIGLMVATQKMMNVV